MQVKGFLRNGLIPLSIFAAVFLIYSLNLYTDFRSGDYRRLLPSGDAVPNTFLPYILLKDKTFIFDEQVQHLRRFENWVTDPAFLVRINGHYYSAYPPLTGILAVPFYFIPLVIGKVPDIGNLYYLMKVLYLGRIAASFYTSLSAVFVYFALLKISSLSKLKNNKLWVILFTLFYALGTCSWSISSRGLWQHTVAELLVSIMVYLFVGLYLSKVSARIVCAVGLIAGLAVLARPTNILLAVALMLYFYAYKREYFFNFVAGVLPSALFFLIYNYAVFGSPFMEGYGARGDFRWSTPIFNGLMGFLFSPARSFLFVSPPLVLSYCGIVKTFKDKNFGGKFNIALRFLSVSFIAAVLLFSKWYTWHGGSGFGYRMLTDFLPIVVILAYLVFMNFSRFAKLGVIILMLYSAYIQFNAVNNHYSRCGSNHNWDFYCLAPRFL